MLQDILKLLDKYEQTRLLPVTARFAGRATLSLKVPVVLLSLPGIERPDPVVFSERIVAVLTNVVAVTTEM